MNSVGEDGCSREQPSSSTALVAALGRALAPTRTAHAPAAVTSRLCDVTGTECVVGGGGGGPRSQNVVKLKLLLN